MSHRFICIFFVSSIFAGLGASAQTDLSGTRIFKGQQSVSGNLYSNGSPKSVSIKQDAGNITLSKTTAGNAGDVTSTETVAFNGQTFETITPSKRKKTITGSWDKDKKTFTEITHLYDATDSTKLFHTVTDSWTMQNGQLILDRKDENASNNEVWESKATYDKQ